MIENSYPLFEVIILSYMRPNNISKLIKEILKINRPIVITINNNNPNIDLTKYIEKSYLEEINLIQNSHSISIVNRILVAKESCANYFISIDDDMLMKDYQVELLMDYLLDDESIPHGCMEGQVRDCNVLKRVEINGEVDVLNSVYAFTKAHVNRFFELINILNIDLSYDNIFYEDIILSFCGDSCPRCHDLGKIEHCVSTNSNQIAVHKLFSNNFAKTRLNICKKLLNLNLYHY